MSAWITSLHLLPQVGRREPGLQPPDVAADLDHTHREATRETEVRGPGVETAPPPAVPFVPQSPYPYEAIFAHYRNAWHPAYMQQHSNNAAVLWAATQQAK